MDWAAAAVILAALAGQSFWMNARMNDVSRRTERLEDTITARFDQVGERFDRIEATVLKDHGERIARLEAQARQE
jgi:hypothetical protein